MSKNNDRPNKPPPFGQRHRSYCPKLRRSVNVTSLLEHERRLQLTFDAEVSCYEEQSGEARAFIDGKLRRSYCDFRIESLNGRIRFEEIKYASELRDPRSRAHRQIAIQRAWCEEMGFEHRVVTDEEIWANPTLNNSLVALMAEFTDRYPALLERAEPLWPIIQELVLSRPGLTIQQALESKPCEVSPELFRFAVMEMILDHAIDARVESVVLSPQSSLFPVGSPL